MKHTKKTSVSNQFRIASDIKSTKNIEFVKLWRTDSIDVTFFWPNKICVCSIYQKFAGEIWQLTICRLCFLKVWRYKTSQFIGDQKAINCGGESRV